MTEEFMKEEKQITSQFDHDPLLKLKSREIDLRAMDQQRKKEYDEARVDIDQAKLVQAKDIAEDKLEQNEELAELRADTTMDKAYLAAGTKLTSDTMKRKDVKNIKRTEEIMAGIGKAIKGLGKALKRYKETEYGKKANIWAMD